MRTEFLRVSVLRVASGPRVKLASCKSALNPQVVHSTDRSKAVVPVLVLFFVALWFILPGDLLYVFPCVILFLCFSSPVSIAITSLGEERANLSTFRTFVRFVLVWICRFPLPLGVWEGLRFVIVALPGLFSYLFLGNSRRFIRNAACMRNLNIHIRPENGVLSLKCGKQPEYHLWRLVCINARENKHSVFCF